MNAVDYFLDNQVAPEHPFLLGGNGSCTYGELKRRVAGFRKYLDENYPENEKFILLAANSMFFVVPYLAIMQSRRVVIPLNPAIDVETFREILDQTQTRHIVASRAVRNRLDLSGFNVIDEVLFDQTDVFPQGTSFEPDGAATSPNELAQIIFTSGSTAKPKGVMISHQNLMANTQSIIDYLHLTSDDIMEVVLPFYYCYGLSLLHTHLRVGGSLVLNNNFALIGGVINDLNKYQCTGFAGVPSHYQILLRKNQAFQNTSFPYLRYVTQAGGKLHDVFIHEFRQAFPQVNFYVMYGQTEATARLSYLDPAFVDSKTKSIGKGIPGVELKVVDELGSRPPVGEVGEIIARGGNIMLGYWHEELETRQAIRDGWLYTGDLGHYDEDGFIFLTSRKKEIIKVGGNRVSPKEIEEVIVSMPGVVDCSIVPIPHDILGEAIRAIVVVGEAGAVITKEDVQAYCAGRLVAYKVPVEVEISSQMAVSSSGKKVKK
ncbi:MAG: AMP-binding protein [Breznakibacter sp.]